MAHRLSAKSANKVLLCEAGQDTPPGNEPPEIRDSYSGLAYFDPRFHWTELKVTTQVVSHNNPEAPARRLRKYEQARVLGGGSSINGQMANRGAPTDYDEWEARGAAGWNWNDVLPYFKKVERDLDFDGPFHGKDGRIPGPPHPEGALDQALAGRRRGLQARRLHFPARPERRVRRRLFSGDAFQPGRAARLGGDGLSRSRDAQARQSDDLDQHAGQGAAVRGHALRRRQGAGRRPRTGVPRPRGHPVVRRDPFAGASAARRHRPGRASEGDGHSGADGPGGRRPAADGSSLDRAVVLHPPRRAHE